VMTKHPKRPRDFSQAAKLVVDIASGQVEDRELTPEERGVDAFSKKVENHAHAVALHMMYYNFVRIHQTVRMTPAMAAGVTKRLWEMTDVMDVLEAFEAGSNYGNSN
jgi:hypothetical protein